MRILTILLLLFSIAGRAQQDPVMTRIILIGDAGEIKDGKIASVEKARSLFDLKDGKSVVIYLGDNVYEYGLPDSSAKDFEEKKKVLDEQISLVKGTPAKTYFIPGNHDWKRGKSGGWQQVKNQQRFLEAQQMPNLEMLPKNGCPGPVEVVVNDKVVIVFMDSQWWLEQLEKPGINSDCECQTEDEIATALKEIASVHSDKLMVIAMHHPFYTHGPHGGYYTIKQHVFPFTDVSPGLYIPLPIIGSIYPITRGLFGTPQDINHPNYRGLIRSIEEVMKSHPNIVHVSGHEHALQFLQKDSINYIVSGSGAKLTRIKEGKYSQLAEKLNGFAVLEITQGGKVTVNYFKTGSDNQPIFTASLKSIPPKEMASTVVAPISFPDSASSVGSSKFKISGFRKFLVGNNYRKEWGETVKAPVLDIGKENGGLTPLRRGGGHQTKSLRFEDASGKEWVLRGVEKSVTDAALPPDLRGTFAKDVVQDGVSASYPYGALSVPILAEAAGVPHAEPKLVYVPDDPRLGRYRLEFANTLNLLEEREPGGFKKTVNTVDLAEKLKDDNDNHVDQHALLKARLLDMFIMDFDRHEDQWRWGVDDQGKGNRYVALPRDRDQAFFINEGIVSGIASWAYIAPQLQGFRSKARNIKIYNFNARNLDRAYLNEMNEEDWKKGSDSLISVMTDEVIEKALTQQPEGVKKYSYGSIINKLKERRKYYPGEMLEYYRFISKIVNITGSDKHELFDINRESDGSVTVIVYKISKEGQVSTKLYERKFDPDVTKELRIYGMGNADKFNVHGPGKKIKIRIIGGSGDDVFENNSGGGKTIAYDIDYGRDTFNGKFTKKLSGNPDVNNYERLYYKYNLWIPFISFAYNRDDGLFLGASIKHIAHGFRKDPYAFSFQAAVNHSVATKSYNFMYNLELIKAIGSFDIVLHADIKAPNNVSNFFGLGNETVNNIDTKPGKIDYYRTRYAQREVALLFRKGGRGAAISFGPEYASYSLDSNENIGRIIMNPAESGVQIEDVTKSKSWMGGQVNMEIDTRNNPIITSRGLHWKTTLKVLSGLNDNSNNLTQLNSDLSLFMSFSKNPKLVLATRFGGGINFGKNYEFFQAQYLGGEDRMREFRKYRFAGKSALYNNIDLRLKIADFRTYLFPASFGLVFFHDIGRVWVENDNSGKWHSGFGSGIWISPLRRMVIMFSMARSDEETLPVLDIGFQF